MVYIFIAIITKDIGGSTAVWLVLFNEVKRAGAEKQMNSGYRLNVNSRHIMLAQTAQPEIESI